MKTRTMYRSVSLLAMISLMASINVVAHAATRAASPQATVVFTFTPIADAYVIESTAATNFGSNLSLREDSSPITRSYLRFAVTGLNGGVIQSAKLRIYANSASTTGFSVRALADNTWAEDKITYINSPAVGNIINSSIPFSGGVWIVVDISSYVKAEGTYNLALTTTNTTNINLASREATGKSPELLLTANVLALTSTSLPTLTGTPTQIPSQIPSTNTLESQAVISTSTSTAFSASTSTPTALLPTTTSTRTGTPTAILPTTTSTRTGTPTRILPTTTSTRTRTPTRVLPTATSTRTRTPTRVPPTATPTRTHTPTRVPPTNTPTRTPTSQAGTDWQPPFPIRAAFYYPWFANAWTQSGIFPYTNYTPQLGYYDSADLNIIRKHIDMMQYGKIQAAIASWWGQGHHTDNKIPGLLAASAGTQFRWALYYENESMGDPSVTQINSDLVYIRDRYGKDPSFLRVNGKFVVFVYATPSDTCGMADRWKKANTVGAYIVLKVFSGYTGCVSQPDSWHQYSPAVASDQQGNLSYSISPGFWLKGSSVRLARDITRWKQNVRDMVASNSNWQLVTTFNEWGEGTIVEPALQWPSASGYGQYLDALHYNGSLSIP